MSPGLGATNPARPLSCVAAPSGGPFFLCRTMWLGLYCSLRRRSRSSGHALRAASMEQACGAICGAYNLARFDRAETKAARRSECAPGGDGQNGTVNEVCAPEDNLQVPGTRTREDGALEPCHPEQNRRLGFGLRR